MAVEIAQPIAKLPTGEDPVAFYATFAGKVQPVWDPVVGLDVWLDPAPAIAGINTPLKSALRFVPVGASLDGVPTTENILALQTWPTIFVELKETLGALTPSEVRLVNVDPIAVRAAVDPLFTAFGKSAAAVTAFMAGDGLLRVDSGTLVGAAAPGAVPPTPATPNRVRIVVKGSQGDELHPVEFLAAAADQAAIDKTIHPVLSQLNLEGWVEITALATDDTPLANEPFVLHLSDGSTRNGNTDVFGLVSETGLPPGEWAIEFTNHPSFKFEEQ